MPNDLEWNQEERAQAIKNILALSDNQIWDLFEKFEIALGDSFDDVITEIRENEEQSMNLDILFDESNSKQELLDAITEIKNSKLKQ